MKLEELKQLVTTLEEKNVTEVYFETEVDDSLFSTENVEIEMKIDYNEDPDDPFVYIFFPEHTVYHNLTMGDLLSEKEKLEDKVEELEDDIDELRGELDNGY